MSSSSMTADISYFGYNAFLVTTRGKTIAVDPGRNLSWTQPGSLIPEDRWPEIDLVLVTHAHPDHCDFAAAMSQASGAPLVCGKDLSSRLQRENFEPVVLKPGNQVECQGVRILGIPVRHGPSFLGLLKLWLRRSVSSSKSLGYLVEIGGLRLLTLGDTKTVDSWKPLEPHILLAPIGGTVTLNADEALLAAEVFDAQVVIPCHYDCPFYFFKRLLRADPKDFCQRLVNQGRGCVVLNPGERVSLAFDR